MANGWMQGYLVLGECLSVTDTRSCILPRHRSPLLFVVMMKHVTSVHFPLSLIVIHLSLVSVQVSACNHIVGRLCVKCFSVDVCIYSIILCFSDCHDSTCAFLTDCHDSTCAYLTDSVIVLTVLVLYYSGEVLCVAE